MVRSRNKSKGSNKVRRICMLLLPLLVLLAAGNLFYGAVPIPPGEVLDILLGGGGDNVCPRPLRPCWRERPWL